MSYAAPRVLSIPPGVRFLPALAEALVDGHLVPDFRPGADPLALADVTIYVPTRRAARELRTIFVERTGGRSVILPTVRPLGEFDEDVSSFLDADPAALDLVPPISSVDRLLLLAPLVQRWKKNLPAHVAAKFAEEVVVPASAADSLWLARDLAALIDEVETEGAAWSKLAGLVDGDLAAWWQVTLDFLAIVTEHWPGILALRGRSDPAAHRNALIRAEAERLKAHPPAGPVIAAGSTGSIPATAALLAAIARLPRGAVVLPGLDRAMDEASWKVVTAPAPEPAVLGHPQFGLAKLLGRIGVLRADIEDVAAPSEALAARAKIAGEAFRPAATTDLWASGRGVFADGDVAVALGGVSLVEAANERDEAAAIAIALRLAVEAPGKTAALVTGDRDLARRVSAELLRFGIRADDSGGTPLSGTPPAALLTLMLRAVFQPGDPVPVLALLKHPLLSLGLGRAKVRRAVEVIELVALRGGYGRPEIATLAMLFEERLAELAGDRRAPFWFARLSAGDLEQARAVLAALGEALAGIRREAAGEGEAPLSRIVKTSVVVVENLVRGADGGLDAFYSGDAGQKLAEFLRGLVGADAEFAFPPREWPDVFDALIGPETVKPAFGSDSRVSIWGALEARLLSPDTLVVGGLNEGVWPRKAVSDRFMSRVMKAGIALEPPERRIGQSAHDFQMALGIENLVLTRAARSGDAPAVASRWLQRILTFAGPGEAAKMRTRGGQLLAWARALDLRPEEELAARPNPKPPVAVRPKHFSVTEIETLRRDPYAIYARRILELFPVDPLVRDPGAAERGTLFHEILHRFSASGVDPASPEALDTLLTTGRAGFAAFELPDDVSAVWWPRFERLAANVVAWEAGRADSVLTRLPELRAAHTPVGRTGVTLSGYADRVDLLPANMADILDYKTGSSPSKIQAHRLIAPQLALEAALLRRGAFADIGRREPADLAYIRLKPNGEVVPESVLEIRGSVRSAADLAEDSWARLERLLDHYALPSAGYLSRALPFREGDMEGDYDHLARVLEWSAGGEDAAEAGE
ncbi:double-strand break repair protein AddB [Mesorhizobium sp. LHD-90]|uniref:double-strand break repair protein AddB n=1 Tax=Mesorhizobium sp. LHD-90 TaxID=3071414 RepID=UPI0027E1DE17|nr:double-strand break repair protein AddB [Mesorhizobium sp. LHD-90]MDQ6434209.1 double-strand break repair protein AddB [Mesorhizobium sp. LHD-90]